MTFVTMQHMPLSSAYLCQDCDCIGNNAKQCPACASAVLMGLASVLDREQHDKHSQLKFPLPVSYSRLPALVA
jgi:hypothetical protein